MVGNDLKEIHVNDHSQYNSNNIINDKDLVLENIKIEKKNHMRMLLLTMLDMKH